MRKLIVVGAAAVGAAGVVMASFGAGVASADALSDVTGKYYGQAKEVLASAGLTPVVATRVGDQVTDDDCVIDWIHKPSSASNPSGNTVYVHLNCYANVASPQQAGYSRQSELGSAAYEAQQQAAAEAAAQQEAQGEETVTAENQH